MSASDEALPVADLDPHPITMDQYHAIPVEKFELWDGYLFHTADDPEGRVELLRALLVNTGLAEAVRLAPEERWRPALERVYGSGPR